MAAEIHALVLVYDFAFIIGHLAEEILGSSIQLDAFFDRRTVIDVIVENGMTTERRLQIDNCALKQSYMDGVITRLGWIQGNRNPADALTKITKLKNGPLWSMMTNNELTLQPIGWVPPNNASKNKISGVWTQAASNETRFPRIKHAKR